MLLELLRVGGERRQRGCVRRAGPHGCLGVQGALSVSDSGREVRDLLVAWRNDGCCRIRDRFQRAVDEGDLPPQADPQLLARYLTTFAYGIAVQAASGVSRDELQELADAALRDGPLS
ncbi:TetR family transcriptional regulator C-terminal domain-containing protein [Streptomyces sp. yr375]|uniref:TetR family transcriptional regulator C-terminal domain-containing protein n=1 Tax=Streptomyces sp. yr375 TaxID=1761906 RepID=UPI000A68ACB9